MQALNTRSAIMEVREAIIKSKEYIKEIFSGEKVEDIGLEELEFDDARNQWSITLGFSRLWPDQLDKNIPSVTIDGQPRLSDFYRQLPNRSPLKRTYKVITITKDGQILSLKNRRISGLSE